MTAISATGPSIGTSLAQLIADDSGESATSTTTPAATTASSDGSSTATSSSSSGPASYFTLSDAAKANLAASNRLDAYAAAHRDNGGSPGGETNPPGGLLGTLETSIQFTGTPSTTPRSSTANGNETPPFQTFVPTKNISKSVTYDGYTLTLNTDASTQWYGIELNGNGVQAYSKHFGSSDGAAGASGVLPGMVVSAGPADPNNEAFDAITVTRNTATASSASISSSAGSASTSSANAQSSSITFLVNYATGAISVEQSAASVSTQSSQSSPGSNLSALA